MTDSMKFGPEWLRNMSNDMSTSSSTSSTTSSTTAPLGPRYQLAEYRYGREEMLSLFDKNLKTPEILPTFKTLYVDKVQCPLALTPSTEDEVANSTRPWGLRSPVSLPPPTRGAGRGGSADRGRTRTRGTYPLTFQRPVALYDEDIRGLGRAERGWSERNGGNEIGGPADWNGSPSSSPRKEYNNYRPNPENWRRNRNEEDNGDGWRGTAPSASNNSYRWCRLSNWRDEDPTSNAGGGSGEQNAPPLTRSFSSSATIPLERSNSNTSFKVNSQINQEDSMNKSTNSQWEQDDGLPEWAMENPVDSGGSFDASGAFHGSNEGNEEDNKKFDKDSKRIKIGRNSNLLLESESNIVEINGTQEENPSKKLEEQTPKELPTEVITNKEDPGPVQPVKSPPVEVMNENVPETSKGNSVNANTSEPKPQLTQPVVQSPGLNVASSIVPTKPVPPLISEISDQMQEAADDMVEKLIMDDEVTISTKSLISSIIKGNSAPSSSPTGVSLIQQPPVNNHQLLTSSGHPINDVWYYRDPQGKVQGPFTATEMAEWYRTGYFDENLLVRRVCDSRFAALGELKKLCGNSIPFLSSNLIPPLLDLAVPHISNNQPAPQIAINSKQNVNSMLDANDVMTINLQLQFLQKQFLLRQQSLILSKLAATEPWSLLNAEQRQQLVNQQMSQVVIPDNLLNISALSNTLSLINPANYPKQTPPLHPLGFGTDFSGQSSLHNMMQGNMPQPPPNIGQPPTPIASGPPNLEHDPIKSLLMQLHLQNKMPGATPPPGPPMPNKWSTMPTQPWSRSGNASASVPAGMWDFGPTITTPKPEMTLEQQILEEQMLNNNMMRHIDLTKSKNERPDLTVAVLLAHAQAQQHQSLQQSAEPPNTQHHGSMRDTEKSKTSNDEKIQKIVTKHDEEQKKVKSKAEKKENRKILSEEERKKEAIEEKKRQKEEKKRHQLEEEKKRQQQLEEDKRRQLLEEKKRQEEIDQHRRAKMMENSVPKPVKTNFERTLASSVAPWINTGLPGISTPGPNFAEIQKAERERRAEEQRLEQLMEHQRKNQMEMVTQKENVLKWNSKPLNTINVKSLAEIQAEEVKRLASEQAAAASIEQRKKEEVAAVQSSSYGNSTFSSIWNNRSAQKIAWSGTLRQGAWSTTSSAGFWEEPTKMSSSQLSSGKQPTANPRALSKSQTISNITSVKKEISVKQNPTNIVKPGKGKNKKDSSSTNSASGQQTSKDEARNEFTCWCIKTLSSMNSGVDVPTFISFLQDIESPFEVKDYIRMYLGETKECTEFAKQFLERRSKYKNQQRAQNAHIDDMCSPAPAINPANDFQEVKGKGKKVKKNKMTKLDARILGFSVTAAQDRFNVGDRDYGDAS